MKPIGLHDVMPFGKHAGRAIGDLLANDPAYLLWLRDERKSEGKASPFDRDVQDTLDVILAGSKKLQMKHKPWNGGAPMRTDVIEEMQKAAKPEDKKPDDPQAQEAAYKDQWGAF